jgi:RNA polymerase sigma factor (sigma-70 family)
MTHEYIKITDRAITPGTTLGRAMQREDFPEQEDTAAEPDATEASGFRELFADGPRPVATIGEATLTAVSTLPGTADAELLSLIYNARHLRRIARQLAQIGVYHIGPDDVWQEAIINSLGRNIDPENVTAYVVTAAHNHLASLARKQRVQRLKYGQRMPHEDAASELADMDNDLFSRMEQREELNAALRLLPSRMRRAVVLRYVHAFTVPETAQAMDCAEGTIKSLCSHGTARLRYLLSSNVPH